MKAFGITDSGKVRKENQDCFRFDIPESGDICTAVLCDGMGGAQAGSIASRMAADAFMFHAANSLDAASSAQDMKNILVEAVNYANIKVYDRSFADFACMGMGSTLVAFVATEKRCFVANVGDSRAYLIAGNKISQISRDHSLVEELVEQGKITPEEAQTHPQKNIITRAIGVEASVHADIFKMKPQSGDILLLCSDGLSNLVSDAEMLEKVKNAAEAEDACRALLDTALERGAPDNVTVLIAEL
ncbi:MAG: Stp1/IreP family PP2C-type Ser/Thr phosphatase [Oscillospiraceae bacterium]|nr:Stp1/IreP family PP2C-type Ser/Thr phosphatase [Oscillospiraceae bacterium]